MRDLNFRAAWGRRPIDFTDLAPPVPVAPLALDGIDDVVALRRFPFPYGGMLAISDCSRGADPAMFAHVRKAFAERGLEIGACASFSADDPCAVGTPLATELAAAGLLDTVTGLPEGGAEAAAEKLAAAGLSPRVFAGGAPVADAAPLAAAGVRYFTDDAFSARTQCGAGFVYRNPGELRAAFGAFDYGQFGFAGMEPATDLDTLFAALPEGERRAFLAALFDAPLFELPGHPALTVFKRFAGQQAPSLSTLALQLRSQFLTALQTYGAAAVIQQRMGEDALIGMPPAQEERRQADPLDLDLHAQIALDDLAEQAVSGVLVAATGRLLDWLSLRRHTKLALSTAGVRWQVTVTAPPDLPIEGLAVTLPAGAPETLVVLEGEATPLPVHRTPDPLAPGRDCLYLPWETRLWPST